MSINIGDLPEGQVARLLRDRGLGLRTGPFWINVKSTAPEFTQPFRSLYASYPADPDLELADFHVSIDRTSWFRRYFRPQILFKHDGEGPFYPLPAAEAAVMLEWGLNWCVSTHAHQFLIIHAGVVARGDDALLMSAISRSGKSTLTAALIHRGWRLLSDELALIDCKTGLVWPLCRPVNLKGQSIDVIRDFAPNAEFHGHAINAHKGDVALMRVPDDSVAAMARPARVRWLVEPFYTNGAAARFYTVDPASTMMRLAENSFNYGILEEVGFRLLSSLVAQSVCLEYHYSDLNDAIEDMATLTNGDLENAA